MPFSLLAFGGTAVSRALSSVQVHSLCGCFPLRRPRLHTVGRWTPDRTAVSAPDQEAMICPVLVMSTSIHWLRKLGPYFSTIDLINVLCLLTYK